MEMEGRMKRTIKSADMNVATAAELFAILNKPKVEFYPRYGLYRGVIFSEYDPEGLLYPEGWYYAKGMFRNKHNSSSGMYEEIPLLKPNGDSWER